MAEVISLGLMLVVLIVLGTLAYAAVSAAPWVPLRKRDINRLIKLANIKPGEIVYDLGCGDGRVLQAVVKQTQARAVGFEISLLPYIFAKVRSLLLGTTRVQINYKDFFKTDFSTADVIVCFLTPYAMVKLESKINCELKPGARFLTYAFPLPNRKPTLTEKDNPKTATIFLYS